MKRDLIRLSEIPHDLLIVGGGIYGLCMAWDAALRGLSVALVDKGDFGHATSFNSLKLIHRGLRYLRSGDIQRVRRSIREARAWMRIAPHLVHPVPFLVPTYGHGLRGKELAALAVLIHDVLGFDLKGQHDFQKNTPRGRVISKLECAQLLPGVEQAGLTGGVIFSECQMSSTERLIVSLARSASNLGCKLANYIEVVRFLSKGARVVGVSARDVLTGDEFDIRAKVIVNSAGPWLEKVRSLMDGGVGGQTHYFKAFNLLIKRPLVNRHAIGVYSKDKLARRHAALTLPRLFFVTPWCGYSLIGTAHLPSDHDPDNCRVTESEIQTFLGQLNHAHPPFNLNRQDVCFVYGGLVPSSSHSEAAENIRPATRHQILDHLQEGIAGLISVAGVKFTEARHVAEKTVDLVFRKLGRTPPGCTSAATPLHGGQIECLNDYLSQETRKPRAGLNEATIRLLIYHYGAAYPAVLQYLEGSEATQVGADAPCVMQAEVLHGIHEEMALCLSDVVLRRIPMGMASNPGTDDLESCAAIMSRELNWSQARTNEELRNTKAALSFGSTNA